MVKPTARKVVEAARVGMTLLPPGKSHGGRTPEEWLELWSKWFVKNNRDEMNENQNLQEGYVMLRGQMRSQNGYKSPLVIPLNIQRDTILCFPLLCTLSSKTWEQGRKSELDTDPKLKKDAEKHNNYQFMHHVSVTLDGNNIIDWNNSADRQKVEARAVTTPPFSVDVDPGDWQDYEGPQVKEIDGIILTPGKARTICSGAFFLAKLEARESPYILRIRAGGVNDYYVHAIYTIKVN